MVSREIHLVSDLILASLEIGSKLRIILVNPIYERRLDLPWLQLQVGLECLVSRPIRL